MVILTINRWDSNCGACGLSCLPHEETHTTPCGYDRHEGCGARYTHVRSGYFGQEEEVRKMRPDLIFMSPEVPDGTQS